MMKFNVFLVAGALLVTSEAAQIAMAQTEPPVESPAQPTQPTEIAPAETPPPDIATVHVIAENVESAKGTIWLALCNTDLTVEGCPYKLSVPAAAGFVEVTFENIPPGTYAVVGYHDANGDDVFNRTLGVPREPYALSGPAGEMLAPAFEDAAIEIRAGMNDVILRLGRLVG